MKSVIYFTLIFAVQTLWADSWQNLEFSVSTKTVSLPLNYVNEMNALSRRFQGHPTDFFSELAWDEGAEKVMIWAPHLNFKDRKKPYYKIGSQIFLNLQAGGVLFCKGCSWAAEFQNASLLNLLITPAYASDACTESPYKNFQDINQALKTEVNQRSIFDSLKTCNWSLTEMIKKTVTDVVSGTLFRDLLNVVSGLESAMTQFRDQVAPMLAHMREHLGEIYDHLVCDFSQQNMRAVVMGIVLPGGGTAGAVAKIAVNVAKLKKNLELWAKNSATFNVLFDLKKKYNGKLPPHFLAAMSEIRSDLPVKPKGFGSSRSLESHFRDHSELGFKTAADYEKAALRFSENTSASAMVIESKAKNNWVKFDPATKEYAVMNRNGELVTYFKKDHFSTEQAFEHFLQNHTATYL